MTLDVDGYALLDESSARDVVRDDDVVRARWGRGREGGEGTRATIGDVLKRPLAPPVSDEEGEPNAGVEGERETADGVSARRKSNKRARRREEYQTIEDLQVMSEDGEERDAEDAGRREEERWPSPLKILPGDPWKTTTRRNLCLITTLNRNRKSSWTIDTSGNTCDRIPRANWDEKWREGLNSSEACARAAKTSGSSKSFDARFQTKRLRNSRS